MTLKGNEDVSDSGVLIRKRRPSAVTSYCLDVPGTNVLRRFERFCDLRGKRQRLLNRYRTLRSEIGERRTLDQLHHQAGDAAAFLEAVNLRDVRVVQRRECLGLALEPRQPGDSVTGR